MTGPCPVWVLTGPRRGEREQQLVVARALSVAFEEKPVFAPGSGTKPGFGWQPDRAVTGLTPPWPEVAITFGRTLEAGRWLKAASAGATRLVHLGRPRRTAYSALDLIVSMPQDRVPAAENVLPLRFPLNLPPRPDDGQLRSARQRLAHLPRPWVMFAIGGPTRHSSFSAQELESAVRQISAQALAAGGSVLIANSPRTPAAWISRVRSILERAGTPNESSDYRERNAYAEYLALSDECMVTGDSASMIAECWRTGKPVSVVPLRASPYRMFTRAIRWVVPSVLLDPVVRRGWISASVEIDGWIADLQSRKEVQLLGAGPGIPRPTMVDDDLERLRQRILGLMAPAG